MAEKNNDINTKPDEGLDELLDSALADFEQQPEPFSKSSTNSSSCDKGSGDKYPADGVNSAKVENKLEEAEFQNTWSSLEHSIKSLFNNEVGDQLSQQLADDFKKIAEDTMKQVNLEPDSTGQEFSAAISETLQNLAENADSVQGCQDDLLNMIGAMGFGGEGEDGGNESGAQDLGGLFEEMLKVFLSKDFLYPSLKELISKYPDWLKSNEATLSKEDFARYTKQFDALTGICNTMEKFDDNEENRSEQYTVILEMMKEMQECGPPPKALIGTQPWDLPLPGRW